MSFLKPKSVIDEGDTVVLFLNVNSMHIIQATATVVNKKGDEVDNIFQTSYGALKVKMIIGMQYGSKVQLSKGWAYLMQPNPELWTQTLPHRTQIIYTPDVSMIIHQLDIRPGSIVIESGTGSGSLSHFFVHAVKPTGMLHTFDFHEGRVNQARDEFRCHGLDKFVQVYNRDVCQLGFDVHLDGKVDAVFLDLPAPQLVIPHAVKAFKNQGGRFCSFSPCIEQSQRCCEALKEHGFTEIQSMEVLQQENIVKTKTIPVMNFKFLKEKKTLNHVETTETPKEEKKVVTALLPPTMPGHTGFLTFATLPPIFAR